jgi:hypothetical protein
MKPLWVLINRARNPWKQPTAVQCEECGALCVSEEAWEKHSMWHTALRDELRQGIESANSAARIYHDKITQAQAELPAYTAQQRREGAATHLELMAELSKNDCMKNEYRAEAQRLREGK